MQTLASLRRISQETGRDVSAVALSMARESMLRRLFSSPHGERFAVKGGSLVMLVEGLGPLGGRTTSDLDLSIPDFDGSLEDLETILREVLTTGPEDGVEFNLNTYRVVAQREGNVPGGSVKVTASVGGQKVAVKVDVTFDSRTNREDLVEMRYPALDGTGFPILSVPFAHMAADKIQAMVRHGARTHRLRDHYDLYLLTMLGHVDPRDVAEALPRSMACFGLEIPSCADDIPALSEAEALRRNDAWEDEKASRRFGRSVPAFPVLNKALRGKVDEILSLVHRPAGVTP